MRPNGRRLGAAALALVLGAIGVVTLIRYVQTAEERALAGQQLVDVVVVTEPVAARTAATDLRPIVETRQVPASSRTPGAVDDLAAVDGLVTSVDLVPGEQLLAARFEEDGIRRVAGGDVTIPVGLVEVTVQVAPSRAVGGQVGPGERVAVVATLTRSGASVGADGEPADSGPVTGVLLRQALVTNVQSANPEALADDAGDRSRAAPAVDLLITVALEPAHVERLVFAAENGNLWLAREGEGPALDSGELMSFETVFDGALAEALAAAEAAEGTGEDSETNDADEPSEEEQP